MFVVFALDGTIADTAHRAHQGYGQFVPVKEAQRRPKTTVVETFDKGKDGKPKN